MFRAFRLYVVQRSDQFFSRQLLRTFLVGWPVFCAGGSISVGCLAPKLGMPTHELGAWLLMAGLIWYLVEFTVGFLVGLIAYPGTSCRIDYLFLHLLGPGVPVTLLGGLVFSCWRAGDYGL